MARLNPYLSFNGNCAEAMEFYKNCLGGKLELNKISESPMAKDFPDKQNLIMHAMLVSGDFVLMASDRIMHGPATTGDNITLCINGVTPEELKKYFEALSADGKVNQPVQEAFFGWYGDLTDKFGINWMLQAESKK